MADGRALDLDNEVLTILGAEAAANGPIHLGWRLKSTWEDFLQLGMVDLTGPGEQTARREVRFAELFTAGVRDDREAAPVKTTERTHEYLLRVYVQAEGLENYHIFRTILENYMDLLHNNSRPDTSLVVVEVFPGEARVVIDNVEGFAVYRGEITFEVTEYISHA